MNETETKQFEPDGVLVVNKHAGVTSHDIVGMIRKLYGTRKVGHTGTLDPMATGVLVVLIGRAPRAAEYLVSDTKRYSATLRLGITTDTEDTSGEILTKSEVIPSESEVMAAAEKFTGTLMQVPPMYSALKVGGQKLVDLARSGKTVEREPREIFVHSLECRPTEPPIDYTLDIYCSSGTYVRTLCADIGKALGCGGAMASLCRTQTGDFSIESSHTINELQKMSYEERLSLLLPTEKLFAHLPAVSFIPFYYNLSKNGCEIYQEKIKTNFALGERVRLLTPDKKFYALGEVRDYGGKSAIKAIKTFVL